MIDHYVEYPFSLQFEISNVCNAACPGCVRNNIDYPIGYKPGDNITIANIQSVVNDKIGAPEYLNLDIFKSIFKSKRLNTLRAIEFIGTIDDPLAHPEFLQILEFLRDNIKKTKWVRGDGTKYFKPKIVIHTNASLRTPEYFAQMADILNDYGTDRYSFNFSIDGLEDTNHLYRRNTHWDKIMSNASAFINAGGKAIWQYLIFEWNKHQTEDAKQLARNMNFVEFKSRFDRSGLDSQRLGNTIRLLNNIDWTGKRLSAEEKLVSLGNQYEDRVMQGVNCQFRQNKTYFINFLGQLLPCCFLNNNKYTLFNGYQEDPLQQRFEEHYNKDWNSLYHHTFDEILQHEFYTQDLVHSFDSIWHGVGNKDRIMKCTATCSAKSLKKKPFGTATQSFNLE